jgi:hypothetical protein
LHLGVFEQPEKKGIIGKLLDKRESTSKVITSGVVMFLTMRNKEKTAMTENKTAGFMMLCPPFTRLPGKPPVQAGRYFEKESI